MPMKPGKNETQSEFMSRCVPEMMGDGKRPNDQAVAACATMWRERDGKEWVGNPLNAEDPSRPVVKTWSTLTVKAVTEDRELRMITGVASTPNTDRQGDVIEPKGLQFDAELPLLFAHKSDQPVGIAKLNKATADGVTFTAKILKLTEPGPLKTRVDDVWQMIKAGLIRGVSIGMKPLEFSFLKDGGIHFLKGEVLELSLVTIPANREATIHTVKSYDVAALAASGNGAARSMSGATDRTHKVTKMQTLSEQISAFEARRKTAADRMAEIREKAGESGSTLEAAESDEYDGLEIEITKLDEHISRLVKMEQRNKIVARPIAPVTDFERASDMRSGIMVPGAASALADAGRASTSYSNVITLRRQVPDWVPFVRMARAIAAGKGNLQDAREMARTNKQWMSETPEVSQVLDLPPHILKAAVAPGTTGVSGDSTWAGPLVVAQNMASLFAEFLRPL